MCGIIGYIGPKPVVPVILDGLRRLEYRGYDSAGVAVVHDGAVEIRRSAGKLINLEQSIQAAPLAGESVAWDVLESLTSEVGARPTGGAGMVLALGNQKQVMEIASRRNLPIIKL